MTGSQHFSADDIQFQLVCDRGKCTESSYLKATSHSGSFRAWKYAIKDTNNISPQKTARVARFGNYSVEFCPLHASHALISLSEK